jgi:hypothetical protein
MGARTSASSFLVASLATASRSSGAKSPPILVAPAAGGAAATARPLTSSKTRGREAPRTVEVVVKKTAEREREVREREEVEVRERLGARRHVRAAAPFCLGAARPASESISPRPPVDLVR